MINIILIIYLILASTFGAYWLAKEDQVCKNEDITLFHIIGNVVPAVLFSWIILFFELTTRVVIKKR